MTEKNKTPFKKSANISLIILLLSILAQLVAYSQTKYQLVSPLISQSTIMTIAEPFINIAMASTIASIVALIFYFYSKYLVTIIICGLTILIQQIYLSS